MRYRKLGSSDLEVSEISLGSWLTFAGQLELDQIHANAKASGVTLGEDVLSAIDEAPGDAPVEQPTPAPGARGGVTHR